MAVRIGTSGYSYKEWLGSFYPEGLPAKQMLAYYAARFPTVEINNTFYRMPAASMLASWAAEVPAEFVFVLKATQRLTHQKRLKDCAEDTAYFLRTADELAARLGPIFFQLPPNMKKDVARLDAFLETVPKKYRSAWEFRHETWFADDVYAVLEKHGAALCIADAEDLSTPVVATAPWGYLRLRRQDYDAAALESWARTIREQTKWGDSFVFFKHEEAGRGPRMGADLAKLLA
jgi:uncharacterized protein YecE (DUF72 family)